MKDKKIRDLTLKNVLCIIAFVAFLILCLMQWDKIISALSMILALFKPFILALIFAFIFNLPLTFFMKKLPKEWKGRKIISVVLSLLCIFGVLFFIVRIVAPQVIDSIKILLENIPVYVDMTVDFAASLIHEKEAGNTLMTMIMEYGEEIENFAMNTMQNVFPQLVSITSNVFTMVTNIVLAFVIAIYMTISKERLIKQSKRVLHAFCNEKQYRFMMKVLRLINATFSSFLSGQLVEAMIIGVLCYIGCIVLRIEYAPILGVLIGCTNIIPIFGPIIGTGIGALLLLFVSPWQAIIFVIFGTALQQFESNLIYPRVVGTSVGLSGLWTLAAVTIGGGLFGLPGMIFGLPVFAVVYRLFADEVNRRNALKDTI